MSRSFIILFISIIPQYLQAQSNSDKKDWVINEVYMTNAEDRYGLFVELYNPTDQTPTDLYLTTSKKDPYQYRVRKKSQYNPGLRQKGYRSYKVSVIRFRSRTLRVYGKADTIYLYKRLNYSEWQLKDKMPIIWNDTLSVGRCGNQICYFNMPTPARANKNVDKSLTMPVKHYRISVLGGMGSAKTSSADNSTTIGFGNVDKSPSFGIKFQKVSNHRYFYTATTAAIFQQGYSFKFSETDTTNTGVLTRSTDGYYASTALWIGRDIGAYLTPRIDVSAGANLVLVSFARQVYDESTTLVKPDGSTLHDSGKRTDNISHYQLPVLTFNIGLNYQITPRMKIESLYNILFRTFSKKETTYYQSLNIGISYSLFNKGRTYKEPLLWE